MTEQREGHMHRQVKSTSMNGAKDPSAKPIAVARRRFLQTLSVGSVSLLSGRAFGAAPEPAAKNKFCAFVKPVQSLSYAEMAEAFSRIGYDGLEVAVRDNGYIRPDNVDDQLPRLIDALGQHGLKVTILTSDITSMQQPNAAKVLRAAVRAGIRMYRLGYFNYDLASPIPRQLDVFRASLRDVVAVSSDLGILPVYQNHSGSNLMGAPLWDLHEVIEKYSPDQIGVALDVGHMTIEGGLSWPVQYHLMRPHVRAVYVKDFVWNGPNVEWVPLGEGRVQKSVFDWIRESQFEGPFSLHVEYLEGGQDAHNVGAHVKAFERDLKTLHRLVQA